MECPHLVKNQVLLFHTKLTLMVSSIRMHKLKKIPRTLCFYSSNSDGHWIR